MIRLFCVALLTHFGSTSIASTRSDFLSAMALLSQKKEAQAFQVLERVFSASKDENEKARAALLLLRAPNSSLKQHSRTFYAEFVLGSKTLDLAEKERCRTLRIVGDSAFEDANFDKARETFTTMTRCSDIKESAYAAYKLGWVDLNEKQAQVAFQRWALMANGRQKLPIGVRQPLVRDLGRAWAEIKEVSQAHAKTASSLDFEEEELTWFVTGIKAGYRRLETRPEMDLFIRSLRQSQYYDFVFVSVLEEGLGFSRNACQVMDWIRPYDGTFSEAMSDKLLPWINLCTKEGTDPKAEVAATYAKLNLKGKSRWTRADAFRENGRIVDACLDMVRMFNEVTEPKALPALATNCGLSFRDLSSVLEFQKRAEVELSSLWPKLYQNPALRPQIRELAGFEAQWVKQSPLRSSIYKMLVSNASTFKGTLLPSLFAEGITQDDERKRYSAGLLKDFVPKRLIPETPENQVWRELVRNDLVKNPKNWTQESLEAVLPLQAALRSQDDVALDLWLLWSLGQPESTVDISSFVQVLLRGYEKELTPLRAETLFSLLLKHEQDLTVIWAHWNKLLKPLLKGGHSDTLESIQSFYDTTIDRTLRNEFPPTALRASEQGLWVVSLASQMDRESMLKSLDLVQLIEKSTKVFTQKTTPSLVTELKALQTLAERNEAMDSTRLSFSTSLPAKIKARVGQIQSSLSELGNIKWSHQKLLAHAQRLFVNSVRTLEKRIGSIPRPSFMTPELYTDFMEQLSPVRSQLEGWRNEIEPELMKSSNKGVQS